MTAPRPTDLIDRVDDEDRVVGTVARGEVFDEHASFRTVHVLVFNVSGEVLLQRVGADRDRSAGLWGSSVAGYVFAGEEPLEAARRRAAEEIGLATPLLACGSSRMEDDGATKFVHVFVGHADHVENLEPQHIAELRFFDLGEVRSALAQDADAFTTTFPVALARALEA